MTRDHRRCLMTDDRKAESEKLENRCHLLEATRAQASATNKDNIMHEEHQKINALGAEDALERMNTDAHPK